MIGVAITPGERGDMGFDMRWRTADPAEAEIVAELGLAFRAACDERDRLPRAESGTLRRGARDWDAHESYDGRTERYARAQDKVTAALDEIRDAEKSYFRLNGFGMGRYCDLMELIGMAFEDEPHPPFPRAEDHGATQEDVQAAEYPEDYPGHEWTDARLRAALSVKEATERVLAFHGKADTPGIPLHKFSSNDGWHVLPAEAEAAVRIWQQFLASKGEEEALAIVAEHARDVSYWLKWIAYLAGAARHGGFEVH
jgi:hypothetical protein